MSEAAAPSPAPAGGSAPVAPSSTPSNGATPGSSQPPSPAPGSGERTESVPAAEAKPQTPRQMVTKHYGKERTWDLENAEHLRELQVLAEIGGSGREKFHEAQKMREEAEAERALLKKDPWALLEKHGLNPDELAEQRMLALLEKQRRMAEMTPEDQARTHVQSEREKLQAEREAFEKHQYETQLQHEQGRILPVFTEHVPKALAAAGLVDDKGAPIGPASDLLRTYLQDAIDAGSGVTPETIQWAAQAARNDVNQMLQATTKGLKGQALVDFLGKDVANELRRHDRDEYLKKRNAPPAAPKPTDAPAPKEPERGYMTLQEFERSMKQR